MGVKGEASSIKMEIFNAIHGNSGGYFVSSIILQKTLVTVGFTGTNGIQSHPPTHRIIANRLLMILTDLHNSSNHGIYRDTVKVHLDRGSVLRSVLVCLSLNFCPTFLSLFSSA